MSSTSVDRLRRFVNRATDHSSCDLCRSELPDRHRHLLELVQRRMLCACDACALLFGDANGSRIRPIPESVTRIELNMSDQQWSGLGIPIGMAFFTVCDREVSRESSSIRSLSPDVTVRHSAEATTDAAPVQVGYPSPAGLVMSSVEQDDWLALIDANPAVGRLRPEVESLLINRLASRQQAFVVPLDVCFELIGIVRRHWEGWSAGPDLQRAMDGFFDQLEICAGKGAPE